MSPSSIFSSEISNMNFTSKMDPSKEMAYLFKAAQTYGLIKGKVGFSCDQTCEEMNRICDPSLLPLINQEFFPRVLYDESDGVNSCKSFTEERLGLEYKNIFPAQKIIFKKLCFYQSHFRSLNCHESSTEYNRICICIH